jgi:hypothetical protein
MKTHWLQAVECKKQGLTGKGEFQSFEDHPELLPAFPYFPKYKKLTEAIDSGELKGIQFTACLRFGGICSSNHEECRKMRGL